MPSSTADMLPGRSRGPSPPGVAVPWARARGRGSGAAVGRERPFAAGRSGAPEGRVRDGDPVFPAFRGPPPGPVPACHLPHRAAAPVAPLTCCVVVAGPEVSAAHLSAPQNLEGVYPSLVSSGLAAVTVPGPAEELRPGLHHFFPPQALGLNIYMTCLLLELVSVVPKDFCGQSKMRVFLGRRDSALGPLLGWKVVGVNLSSWSQGVIRGHRDPFLISSLPPL